MDGVEEGATEDGVTDDLDDGAEEEEDEPTDGEFPGVGGSDGNGSDGEKTEGEDTGVSGSDGNGSDDGICSDGRGSGDEVPRENLFCNTLSLSILTTTKSWNKSIRMSSFIFRLLFFILLTYFCTYFLNFRGAQCKPVIVKNFVSTICSRSFSFNLDNSSGVLGKS